MNYLRHRSRRPHARHHDLEGERPAPVRHRHLLTLGVGTGGTGSSPTGPGMAPRTASSGTACGRTARRRSFSTSSTCSGLALHMAASARPSAIATLDISGLPFVQRALFYGARPDLRRGHDRCRGTPDPPNPGGGDHRRGRMRRFHDGLAPKITVPGRITKRSPMYRSGAGARDSRAAAPSSPHRHESSSPGSGLVTKTSGGCPGLQAGEEFAAPRDRQHDEGDTPGAPPQFLRKNMRLCICEDSVPVPGLPG